MVIIKLKQKGMKKLWNWFKDRGGNVTVLVIGLIVIFGGLGAFLTSKDYVDLVGWKKIAVIVLMACALATGIAGDAVGVFAPNDQNKWKAGFARYVIAIVVFFLLAVVIGTTGTPPLK